MADEPVLRSVQVRFRWPDGEVEQFPLDGAGEIAFEQCSPIRRAPQHREQAHTPGWYWSSTTNRMIEYESHLECVWMKLLDFDRQVAGFSAQPFQLIGVDDQGAWTAVPDLFVRRLNGTALVMEVKNPARLHDETVRRTARRVAACCRVVGWDYQLVGEPPDAAYTANVEQLWSCRRPMAGLEAHRDRLLSLAADPVPFGQLVDFSDEPAVARAVLQHLCWSGEVELDLTTALEDSTLVWASA